jgi:hypothetical protein
MCEVQAGLNAARAEVASIALDLVRHDLYRTAAASDGRTRKASRLVAGMEDR